MAHFLCLENRFQRPVLILTNGLLDPLLNSDERNLKEHAIVFHSLFCSRLNMDQKVYKRISRNIYKTLQEHKEASRELAKINSSKKGRTFFEQMLSGKKAQFSFTRNISQL